MSIRASLRRRFFASGMTVAVLMALLPALPAGAATEACPTTIPKAGFSDLGGLSSETVEAISCVAFYGIAQGTSSTSFAPQLDVSRWQMALFLVRTAQDLGISLPSGASQGFTDLAGFDSATVKAINQLAQLGVTKGTSPTLFAPNAIVPRWQMALFLTRLYAKAGFSLPSGASQGFADIGSYDLATQQAINQLSQLGIAKGTSTTSFSPANNVLRWQMALFLARELDAGQAKPYQLAIVLSSPTATLADSVTATVTVKDAGGKVVSGRSVDVFVGALNSNGTCLLDVDTKIGGGDAGTGTDCTIDNNDPKTDSKGEVRVTLTHATNLETVTVFAWTGESGEKFDGDLVRTKASGPLTWSAAPSALVVADRVVEFGTSATVTAVFKDGSGNQVPLGGQKVVFAVTRDSTQILKETVTSASTGKATFSYVGPADPSPGADSAKVDTIVAFWDRDGDGVDDGAAELDDTATVTWDDDDPVSTSATLTQSAASHLAGQQNTVTVTVTDKFGAAVSGAKVTITISGASTANQQVNSNSSGIAAYTYTGPSSQGVDTIDAAVDLDGDGNPDPGDIASVGAINHHWVEAAPDLDGSTKFDLIRIDTSAKTIDVVEIGGGGIRYRLRYDSTNDSFSVDGQAKSLAQFEAAVTALTLPDLDGNGGTELTTNPYSTATSAASTFVLDTN